MTDAQNEMEVNPQLTEILAQIQSLSARVSQVEEQLMLVTDITRYIGLQEFLSQGNFKDADLETTRVILETIGRNRDNLTPEDMSRFPCAVLQVVDRLWQHYSNHRFGFSVQLKIYQDVGGNPDTLRAQSMEMIQKFGEQLGWRVEGEWRMNDYDQWDFSLSAPMGCFPANWWRSPYGLKMVTFCFLRLIECDL